MQRYRQRLRAEGLRPVQMWVPDTRGEEFLREFRRQTLLVAAREAAHEDSEEARAIQALLDAQDTEGWTP